MEAVRESWTDERLDDLNRKVDDGFRRMDDRFTQVDARFVQMDDRLARVDARLDSLHRIMVLGFVGIAGATVAGFVSLIGVIVTQL